MAKDTLNNAKKKKEDRFYTKLTDIEKELKNYTHHFKDKVVYLNCDDPKISNFWKYFSLKFDELGLKKLIATHYEENRPSYYLEMTSYGQQCLPIPLEQNGDFRSPECIELLKQADIVCTNPPFSLFREYVAQLIEYNKKFIIIGNTNAVTYKEIFPLIKDNKIWIGCTNYNVGMWFEVPDDCPCQKEENGKRYTRVSTSCWYTNLDIEKRHEDIILWKEYNSLLYPKYDNYDAIEVSKVNEIPMDYDGVMGVPITFLDKYNPEQFEIVKFRHGDDGKDLHIEGQPKNKTPYFRILIRRKQHGN